MSKLLWSTSRLLRVLILLADIVFVALIVTIGVSALAMRIEPGAASAQASEGRLHFTFPVTVRNPGLYSIDNLALDGTIHNSTGQPLFGFSQNHGSARAGASTPLTLRFDFGIQELGATSGLLFNDDELGIELTVSARYGLSLVGVSMTQTLNHSWGAPLSGLQFEITPSNGNITVSYSGDNHSPFALSVLVEVQLLDGNGAITGEGQSTSALSPQSPFSDSFTVQVSGPVASSEITIRLRDINGQPILDYWFICSTLASCLP